MTITCAAAFNLDKALVHWAVRKYHRFLIERRSNMRQVRLKGHDSCSHQVTDENLEDLRTLPRKLRLPIGTVASGSSADRRLIALSRDASMSAIEH
ncbi:MAG: hypothetical protein WCE51_09430 [Chthoniobacterales bacterium]|jgi:hypothetical protein